MKSLARIYLFVWHNLKLLPVLQAKELTSPYDWVCSLYHPLPRKPTPNRREFSVFRDSFLHNSLVGSHILRVHASWRNCSESFMALCWKQILPLDMALSGTLGCLQPLASSLFNHHHCIAMAEAVKSSRSHDVLQVSKFYAIHFVFATSWVRLIGRKKL